jgi:hypothetical protein
LHALQVMINTSALINLRVLIFTAEDHLVYLLVLSFKLLGITWLQTEIIDQRRHDASEL